MSQQGHQLSGAPKRRARDRPELSPNGARSAGINSFALKDTAGPPHFSVRGTETRWHHQGQSQLGRNLPALWSRFLTVLPMQPAQRGGHSRQVLFLLLPWELGRPCDLDGAPGGNLLEGIWERRFLPERRQTRTKSSATCDGLNRGASRCHACAQALTPVP